MDSPRYSSAQGKTVGHRSFFSPLSSEVCRKEIQKKQKQAEMKICKTPFPGARQVWIQTQVRSQAVDLRDKERCQAPSPGATSNPLCERSLTISRQRSGKKSCATARHWSP